MSDLTIPTPAYLEMQQLHHDAIKAWYRTGSIKHVMQVTGIKNEDEARSTIVHAADALDALRIQDTRGQRIMSTQRLADMIHRLEDYYSSVKPEKMTRSHQSAMKLAADLQRMLNEITGVEAPKAQGPAVVILGTGFEGTVNDARAVARDQGAITVDVRKPWDVDGEAEEESTEGEDR